MSRNKQYTIPIFVPHYGCPFDCIFCNQERITGVSTNVTGEDVKNIIDEYLSFFDKKVKIEVGFFGGSFTGIDTKIQEELLSVAYEYKMEGKIDAIRLSTRPDFINDDILERLEKYSVDTIELGVQSLNDNVLLKSGRGHSSSEVYNAVDMIRNSNINLGLQMMVGLPGDNFETSLYTCKEFIKLNPECVRIYPTLVIKDTELEKQFIDGVYKSLNLEDAIEQVAIFLMLFNLNNINVIRVGLQPTDNIQLGEDVVSGPFHAAFKQLVDSYIYRMILEDFFNSLNIDLENEKVTILLNKSNISNIVGNKRSNKNFLEREYKINNINFIEDDSLNDKDIKIEIGSNLKVLEYDKFIKKYLQEKNII